MYRSYLLNRRSVGISAVAFLWLLILFGCGNDSPLHSTEDIASMLTNSRIGCGDNVNESIQAKPDHLFSFVGVDERLYQIFIFEDGKKRIEIIAVDGRAIYAELIDFSKYELTVALICFDEYSLFLEEIPKGAGFAFVDLSQSESTSQSE